MTTAAVETPKLRITANHARVRLPDGREGLLLDIDGYVGRTAARVLTDDYREVYVPEAAVTQVRRKGETVKVGDERLYPVEARNLDNLYTAIWHNSWDNGAAFFTGHHEPQWTWRQQWERGEKVPLPAKEDLTGWEGGAMSRWEPPKAPTPAPEPEPVTAAAPAPAAVTVDGPILTIRFDRYDLDSYGLFLKAKTLPESQIAYDWEADAYTITAPARFAARLGAQAAGVERTQLPLAAHLFDYQAWVCTRALEVKRMAAWLDTGLGKTIVFLEWARQVMHLTGGRVLIFTPLAVIPQVIEEAQRFYGDALTVEPVESRAALAVWCKSPGVGLGITNHHKMMDGDLPELRYLAGVVLDEASILKAGGGKIKWALIRSCKGIEYKLACTATPAPNEVMEYASQASWLEKLQDGSDILWTYFHRTKAGDWEVKPHARAAFYQFMASWSVYMRDPSQFGFNDILASLPAPDIREYPVPMTDAQRQMSLAFRTVAGKGMFDDRMGVTERSKFSQLAKGFLYDGPAGASRKAVRYESLKPAAVAAAVRGDVADGRKVLVWTVFDEESAVLRGELPDLAVVVLDGGMSDGARAAALERFRHGGAQVLISKASLIGYGMNLQFCTSMVFSGFDDSFERMYQAVRRCLRFGQTEVVRVHVPYVPELEGMVFNNVKSKEAAFLRDVALQEAEYRKVMGLAA